MTVATRDQSGQLAAIAPLGKHLVLVFGHHLSRSKGPMKNPMDVVPLRFVKRMKQSPVRRNDGSRMNTWKPHE